MTSRMLEGSFLLPLRTETQLFPQLPIGAEGSQLSPTLSTSGRLTSSDWLMRGQKSQPPRHATAEHRQDSVSSRTFPGIS